MNYNKSIKEVPQIQETNVSITKEEELKEYIEEPCLEACTDFFRKNIITVQSSGNITGYGEENPSAWITVDIGTLDEANKDIMNQLVEMGSIQLKDREVILSKNKNQFIIEIPLLETDTVGTISNMFMAISTQFRLQDLLGQRTCFEYLVENLYYSTEDDYEREQLGKTIQGYEINRVNRGIEDNLCYSVREAIEYYKKKDPEHGEMIVEDMIESINNFEEDIGYCDREGDVFYHTKDDYKRHLVWKESQNTAQDHNKID